MAVISRARQIWCKYLCGRAENMLELLASKLEPNYMYSEFRILYLFKFTGKTFSLSNALSLWYLLQSGISKTLFIFMYLPQKLRRFPRKMSAWAGGVVSCTEMYRYGPRVTFCPSLWNTIAIIIMKSGFIRKEADLICLFGSLRAKARLTGWTLDRSKSWAMSEAAHWPTLLCKVFSLAKSTHC